eukprot:5352384-Amphidinium_carterae.1
MTQIPVRLTAIKTGRTLYSPHVPGKVRDIGYLSYHFVAGTRRCRQQRTTVLAATLRSVLRSLLACFVVFTCIQFGQHSFASWSSSCVQVQDQ